MELYYYVSERKNFGDDLNAWLWDELLPGFRDWPSDRVLFGVGTIFNEGLLNSVAHPLVVGSGTGYGKDPTPQTVARCDVRCVRGPLTVKAVGLPEDTPMLDAAMVIPDLAVNPAAGCSQHNDIIFVPHYTTSGLKINWDGICSAVGMRYVSPEQDPDVVIREIAGARLVVAESMHGAITADAYRVPWIPVQINDVFNRHKWRDWAGSLDVSPEFFDMTADMRAARAALGTVKGWLTPKPKVVSAEESSTPNVQAVAPPPPQDRKKLKQMIEKAAPALELILKRRLAQARKKPSYLSHDDMLTMRKKRFFDVLDGIKNDYGS